MAATRIYADFNGLVSGPKTPGRIAVVLDTVGSLRDLCNAGLRLQEGLPLIAVDASTDTEDMEGHGTAEYDRVNKRWVIEFDEEGVRHVPAGARASVGECLCVGCRKPLPISPIYEGAVVPSATVVCSSCGTSARAPFAPPGSST